MNRRPVSVEFSWSEAANLLMDDPNGIFLVVRGQTVVGQTSALETAARGVIRAANAVGRPCGSPEVDTAVDKLAATLPRA